MMVKKVGYYKYKPIRKGWIVINCKTGNHAHFRSEFGCYLITKFLEKDIYPENSYLQESYRRLKSDKKSKQKYVNKQY